MDEANVLKLTTIQTLSFNGWFYFYQHILGYLAQECKGLGELSL